MKKQEIIDLLQYLSQNEKESSLGIFYSLELLDTKLKEAKEDIKSDLQKRIQENRFDDVVPLSDYCKEIEALQEEIASCLDSMVTPSPIIRQVIDDAKANSLPIDYGKYTVDRRDEHFLNEDFEHRKICAFKVEGKYYTAGSWQDTLVTFCEHLAKRNPELLETMVANPSFSGKKNQYFQKAYVRGRNQKILGTDIYVWTNQSANAIVSLIKKMLEYAHIDERDFIVFLRADYSELHKGTE